MPFQNRAGDERPARDGAKRSRSVTGHCRGGRDGCSGVGGGAPAGGHEYRTFPGTASLRGGRRRGTLATGRRKLCHPGSPSLIGRRRVVIDRRLQVFHTVAKLKSFTRAGQRLHMTQPAVTFQIRQLEEHFNTRLFDREHNRIELTAAGRQVEEYAQTHPRTLLRDGRLAQELTDHMAGTLMLGASMTIAEYDLPRLLVRFKQQFPEVNVKLLVSNTDGILHMVVENRIDSRTRGGPGAQPHPRGCGATTSTSSSSPSLPDTRSRTRPASRSNRCAACR